MNLLVIEDTAADFLLVRRHLQKNGMDARLHQVGDPGALAAALKDGQWDAVLSDYNVPGMDFAGNLGAIRSAFPDLPVILVSGTVGEERAIELFKLGVTDFVLKGNLARLGPAITRALHDARELRAKRTAEQALELAIEATGLGMFDHYPQTGEMIWNAEMKRNYGLPVDASASFDTVRQQMHPHDRDSVDRAMEQAMHGVADGRFNLEYRVPGIAGQSERWLQVRGRYFFDGDGRPVRCVGTALDITDRKRAEERIRQTALHDPLTGLPNRGWLFESAAHLFGRARRSLRCSGILFIDLDRFKPINDSHGHEVGDKVLVEVARRLSECTREEDLAVRLGGDEFLVLLPEMERASDAEEVARHVSRCLKQPYRIDGREFSLSVSIGIGIFPKDGLDLDTLINHADTAMYHAKQTGRDSIQFYSQELAVRSQTQARIEQQLKVALADNAFHLHYQPVIDVQTMRLVGVEALVRWAHGGIGPEEFVPVAESTGHIGRLGAWVIAEACRQHRAWREQGLPAIPIAVNVSAVQLRNEGFADQFLQMLVEGAVDPSALQLEVTETALVEHLDRATAVLSRLRALGIRIALDDFGTGYSSLNYLSRLPIDKIKVDKSFVQRLGQDTASRAITEAVIALGRTLQLEVVAEGIEAGEVLNYLREKGCSQAQGYHVCRPVPADVFKGWYDQYRIQYAH